MHKLGRHYARHYVGEIVNLQGRYDRLWVRFKVSSRFNSSLCKLLNDKADGRDQGLFSSRDEGVANACSIQRIMNERNMLRAAVAELEGELGAARETIRRFMEQRDDDTLPV